MMNTKNNHQKHWDTRGRTGTILGNGYKHGQKNGIRNYEHRRIMEEYLGRKLERWEQVHHINGDKLDNNITNLLVLSDSEHQRLHAKKNGFGLNRKGIPPINKTPTDTIKLIKTLRAEGKLLREIQELVGLSWPTVQKYGKLN